MKYVNFHSNYEYIRFLYEKSYSSYDVVNIYDNTIFCKSKFLRFLYRIHHSSHINKYFSLPLKSIWYHSMLPKEFKKDDELCVIFNSSRVANIDKGFYSYLRRHYQCKLVMQLWNPVDWDKSTGNYDIEEMIKIMDLVCTYNKIDVKKYHLTPYPYILYQLENITVKPMHKRPIDVLFVGQDKGRMEYIEYLYNYLTKKGLNCDFYIVNPKTNCNTSGIHCCDWLSYSSLIKMTENAKCIVNLLQPGAEGVTIRDIEAYNFGSFIITNNRSHELREIFNEDQLIDINDISDNIIDVIKNRTESFPKRRNSNSLDNFYSWLDKTLKN